MDKQVFLSMPRGFCAGVERAIRIVELALEVHGKPVYVRREIVHNKTVVDGLKPRGAVFVQELDEVPDGAVTIFSAHGVSPAVRMQAESRGLQVIDATCPLVAKVHLEVLSFRERGYQILLIGHAGHEEVEGTMGEAPEITQLVESVSDVASLKLQEDAPIAVLTQTTLSLDDTAEILAAIKERFPEARTPRADDICYATQNRQRAVKATVTTCDVFLVLGAENSSNSKRLREVAENSGCAAYLIPDAESLDESWLAEATSVGVSAGASAPEELVSQLLERLKDLGFAGAQAVVYAEEDVHFALPPELSQTAPTGD